MRGESVDDADGAEQVRGDRRLGRGGVRWVAQVFGEQHAGHRDDDVEVGVRAEDFVAGAQDGVRVGDVDADGVDAVLGLGVAAPGDDGAAGVGEPLREPAPDARGAAGDEDCAVADLHHDLPVALVLTTE